MINRNKWINEGIFVLILIILINAAYKWYSDYNVLQSNGSKAVGKVVELELNKLYYEYMVDNQVYNTFIIRNNMDRKISRGDSFIVVYDASNPEVSMILLQYPVDGRPLDSIRVSKDDIPWIGL